MPYWSIVRHSAATSSGASGGRRGRGPTIAFASNNSGRGEVIPSTGAASTSDKRRAPFDAGAAGNNGPDPAHEVLSRPGGTVVPAAVHGDIAAQHPGRVPCLGVRRLRLARRQRDAHRVLGRGDEH